MDNLTHSLVGAAIADLGVSLVPARKVSGNFKTIARVAAVIAANLPDADFILSPLIPGKLGYLLHHRGHTHTLLGILPLLLLILLGMRLRKKPSQLEWSILSATTFVSLLSHILLDGLNSYGVHPFWPWDNRWYYGDTLFIIEPWLWFFLLPAFFRDRNPFLRLGSWAFFGAGAALLFFIGKAPVILTCGVLVIAWVSWRKSLTLKRIPQNSVPLLGLSAVITTFFLVSNYTRKELAQELRNEKIESIALTPQPGNPFCWFALVVSSQNDTYTIQKAIFAPFEEIRSVDKCPLLGLEGGLFLGKEKKSQSLILLGKTQGSVKAIREFSITNCVANAYFRFSRTPYVEQNPIQVGDMRFDRLNAPDFSSMNSHLLESSCPSYVPPWEAPFFAFH